jgi:hypothetical protein
MRNKVLKLLKNADEFKDKKRYTELLKLFAEHTNARTVYYYQLGYTPEKFTGLVYDVKQHFAISDKEIALFNPDEIEEEEDLSSIGITDPAAVVANPNEEILKSLNLEAVPEVVDGIGIREEYPFLNDENCPDVFKILVSDKISAYKSYAAAHAEILGVETSEDAEERLYEIGKTALEKWQLNKEIKAELDFYRDSNGKILGKHPLLADLKMKQDVGEMSEADLVKARMNAQKSVSKYEGQGKKDLVEIHRNKLKEVERRLKEDFKNNLK